MEKGLTGQKKAAATRKKKRLYLSPQDWEHLIAVRDTLSVYLFLLCTRTVQITDCPST